MSTYGQRWPYADLWDPTAVQLPVRCQPALLPVHFISSQRQASTPANHVRCRPVFNLLLNDSWSLAVILLLNCSPQFCQKYDFINFSAIEQTTLGKMAILSPCRLQVAMSTHTQSPHDVVTSAKRRCCREHFGSDHQLVQIVQKLCWRHVVQSSVAAHEQFVDEELCS